jgi:mannosylglycerate hydrolase
VPDSDLPRPDHRVSFDLDGVDSARVIHVVAHTHWDREWYHPAVRFQARLVALIDALLAAPVDPATPFLLDGQAIVLQDYLAIRPERTADVARALAAGALEAGPWYVLGDNLIPSGEAILRNLEAGRRVLSRLGARPPAVAYCPDTFGHPAAMPSIARGFGFEVAVAWRGFGGRSFPSADTVWWESADGSRVLLHHLPPDGYEFGSALPLDDEQAALRWKRVRDVLTARNTSGAMMLTVGADHHASAPHLVQAIERLGRHAVPDGVTITRSTLARAAGAMRLAASQPEVASRVPTVRGELRDSYGYTWTLQGTLATRAAQKRRNARLERALLRDVEPWLALAWLHAPSEAHQVAADGSITLAQAPVLLNHAWELLLRTHPHDTLCGCSIDHVAADMTGRQRDVAALIPELREAAICIALSHDRVAARARGLVPLAPVVVRNRASRSRAGVAEVLVLETLSDVRVGPGSAPTSSVTHDVTQAHELRVSDSAASAVHVPGCVVQPLDSRVLHVRRESPQHYPDDDLVRAHRVLAWVPEVPAFGVRLLTAAHHADADASAAKAFTPVVVGRVGDVWTIDNGYVRIEASRDGVTVESAGRRITRALVLETTRDAGDSYTPSLRGEPEPLRLRSVRLTHRGPLRAAVRLGWHWRAGREFIRVWTELSLDANALYVRCDVRGDNRRRDHRLRLGWQTDVKADAQVMRCLADAAFGPVSRRAIAGVPGAQPFEIPPTTMPLHRWLSTDDGVRGATLLSDGLAEGELANGRLHVTLLRAIGELSRNDLPERPGHAGWPNPIPAAQCQGRFAACVGLLLHDPLNDATLDHIEQQVDAFLLPLRGESWRDLEAGSLVMAGPTLEGEGLRASAVCLSDNASSLHLRAVNDRESGVHGRWLLPEGSWQARTCRLDGTPIGAWENVSTHVDVTADSRAIVSVEVRRRAIE